MIKHEKAHLAPEDLRVTVGSILGCPAESVGTYAVLAAWGNVPTVQTNAGNPPELIAFITAASLNLMRAHWFADDRKPSVTYAEFSMELRVKLGGLLDKPPREIAGYVVLALCDELLTVHTSARRAEDLLIFTTGAGGRLMQEMFAPRGEAGA